MTLHQTAAAFRRSLAAMILILLVALGIGAALTAVQPRVYTAQSKAYLSLSGATLDQLSASSTYLQQIVGSYAVAATSPLVLDAVGQQAGLSAAETAALGSRVTVTPETGTVVLDIAASDAQPARAARIANAVASSLADAVPSLTKLSPGQAQVTVITLDPAAVPGGPSSPHVAVNMGVAAAIGAVLAVLFALLRYRFDSVIHTPDDVEQVSDLAVLATIPRDPRLSSGRRALSRAGVSTEAFRTLRSAVHHLDRVADAGVLVVTSAAPGEGKSIVAANLAASLAQGGRSVLLVDADLRRPRLATYLGLDDQGGLADVLSGDAELSAVIRSVDDTGLRVVSAGSSALDPAGLLDGVRLRALLARVRAEFDMVLLDASPVLAVADATELARAADGVLFVVAAGRTKAAPVRLGLKQLEQAGVPIVGLILNRVQRRDTGRPSYRGYALPVGTALRPSAAR